MQWIATNKRLVIKWLQKRDNALQYVIGTIGFDIVQVMHIV